MLVAWEQAQDLEGGAQWTIATACVYLSFQQSARGRATGAKTKS
jgi:hypothetical protein